MKSTFRPARRPRHSDRSVPKAKLLQTSFLRRRAAPNRMLDRDQIRLEMEQRCLKRMTDQTDSMCCRVHPRPEDAQCGRHLKANLRKSPPTACDRAKTFRLI